MGGFLFPSMNRIIRIKSDNNFTIIPNVVFKSGLSLRAVGLLTYILHLPSDWVLYKTWLYENMPEDGKDAIKTAWVELEKKGFIVVQNVPGGKGRFPVSNYIIYDSPVENAENPPELNKDNKITLDSIADLPQREKRLRKTGTLLSTKKPSTKKQRTNIPLSTNVDKGPPAENPPEGCYKKFIAIYDTWFKKLNDGVPPRYDGGNGNAAKSLIAYMEKIVRDKAAPEILDDAAAQQKALQAWEHVLKSWHKLDNFLQQKTRLLDINSNIQNIITIIKNGSTKQKPATGGDVSLADIGNAINAHYK